MTRRLSGQSMKAIIRLAIVCHCAASIRLTRAGDYDRIARSCYRHFEPNLMAPVKKVATRDRVDDEAHQTQIQARLQSHEAQGV